MATPLSPTPTSTPRASRQPRPTSVDAPVRVVHKHHALVRLSHWINVPLLLGLIASGLSIYWAAPVFMHARDPVTGQPRLSQSTSAALIAGTLRDGAAIRATGSTTTSASARASSRSRCGCTGLLAYLFMLNGALYALGLAAGGGWRALLPRPSDVARRARHDPLLPRRRSDGDPAPPVAASAGAHRSTTRSSARPTSRCRSSGTLVVLSGWAMHKPVQLGWLERMFGELRRRAHRSLPVHDRCSARSSCRTSSS